MFLIAFVGEHQPFKHETIVGGLHDLPGVEPLPRDDRHAARFEYRIAGDMTTIEVKDDCMSIKIDGMGEASLSAALVIQRLSDQPVRIIDDSYTFDFDLTRFADTGELYNAIIDAEGNKTGRESLL